MTGNDEFSDTVTCMRVHVVERMRKMRINQEKLCNAMAGRGMFAKDICKRINITQIQWDRMLSGDADISTLSRIAYILNVKVDELAADEENE